MLVCLKCGKEHNGMFGTGVYCSRACANSRKWTQQDKNKKRETVKKKLTETKWGIHKEEYRLIHQMKDKTVDDIISLLLKQLLPKTIIIKKDKLKIEFKFSSDGAKHVIYLTKSHSPNN